MAAFQNCKDKLDVEPWIQAHQAACIVTVLTNNLDGVKKMNMGIRPDIKISKGSFLITAVVSALLVFGIVISTGFFERLGTLEIAGLVGVSICLAIGYQFLLKKTLRRSPKV